MIKKKNELFLHVPSQQQLYENFEHYSQLFDLNNEWEVGFSEIQFLISWYNVGKYKIQQEMCNIDTFSSNNLAVHDISSPLEHYDGFDALVK